MSLWSAILDLLYPPKCVFCGRLLDGGGHRVCAKCEGGLPRASGGRHGDFFDICVSPLYYEDDVRQSVIRYKFRGCSYYSEVYGEIIADYLAERPELRYDIISWAPLSKKRLKKRGYDQAELIAERAAALLGAPCLPTLIKRRNAPAQSGIGTAEKRRANISGAYRILDAGTVRGKRVLLIDDVCTTGSTLSECARVLLMSGAESVICATFARKRE